MRSPPTNAKERGTVEFWSSVEYATFQQGLVCELGLAGWRAEHRYEVSQADYWQARSWLARLWLRTATYAVYPLRLGARFSGELHLQVGVVCTNTFYAPWLAVLLAGRRGPAIVHWVFDLFPDVLILADTLRPGSWRERALRRLVRRTFDRAAVNVFLGERLRYFAEAQFGPISRSVVIPVGCDARPFENNPPVACVAGQPIRVLYCGNMGRMHEVETLVAALRPELPSVLEFNFHGNGAGFRQLEIAVGERNLGARVKVGGNLSEADWVRAMSAADVALVTMKPGAEGVVMPSKTYSALAAGQAVVAICPEASDLADTIRTHECGWVVAPGDANGLARLLADIARQPEELLRRRQNAWQAGQHVFDQRVLAKAWIAVLESARKAKQ